MKFQTAIIGGGPAGMMAAGRAAECGARVVLIERNECFGKKLLITGKGRCNITHSEYDIKKFAEAFGRKRKFLLSSLNRFDVKDTIKFFERLGVKTKVERGGRVFPQSDQAADVSKALENYIKKGNVAILKNSSVKDIVADNCNASYVILENNEKIFADKFIIATGGVSYPATGAKGDGFIWAKKLGHTIVRPKPALAPIITKENWIKDLQGLSLKNVNISIYQNNKKHFDRFGEALFTEEGMSGPIILDMSRDIGELLDNKAPVIVSIDFKPALEYSVLDARIQRDFKEVSNKMFKNSLDKLLPKKLIPVIIRLAGIDPDKPVNLVLKEERKRLLHLLKDFQLEVREIDGIEKAIITSGGVALNEISPQTMQSKIINNLYLAGEILDLDGPTGGYNLQVCWSTGFVAGSFLRGDSS